MFLVMLLLLFKLKPFWTHSEHQEISLFKVVLCLLMCAVVCVCMCVRGHLFSEGLLCLFYVHVCDPPPQFVYHAVFRAENEAQGTQSLVQMFD